MMAINEGWRPRFKELPKSAKKLVPLSEEAQQLELKLLPNGLKYAYIGLGETFSIVIPPVLNEE